jgi:hypothetical protein
LGNTQSIIRSSKTVIAASGFYVHFWLPVAAMAEQSQRPATKKYVKPKAAITVFELLVMGSVSPETR